MPPSREPWIKVKVRTDESEKLASLPSDSARWGWIRVLLKSKTQRRMGIFASRQHLRTVIAPHGRYIGAWLDAGLLHEWPTDCRCAVTYDDAADDELIVHDYRVEQRDPTAADRQADWRDRQDRRGDRNAPGNGKRDADRNGVGDATVTAHSRARGTTETETETETEAPTTPRVLLTAEQLAAWEDFSHPHWEPFKAAWLTRGFRRPPHGEWDDPKSQRALLWEIADARPDDLARWVCEAPGRSVRDIVGWVLEQWHAARQDAARRADADEARSAALKAEAQADGASMTRIGDMLQQRGAGPDDELDFGHEGTAP